MRLERSITRPAACRQSRLVEQGQQLRPRAFEGVALLRPRSRVARMGQQAEQALHEREAPQGQCASQHARREQHACKGQRGASQYTLLEPPAR